jgi:hypothetical protein
VSTGDIPPLSSLEEVRPNDPPSHGVWARSSPVTTLALSLVTEWTALPAGTMGRGPGGSVGAPW